MFILLVVIEMFYYINIFLLCSFLGYVMETLLKTFIFHGMNNGILFGPFIPIYGFGAVIVVFVMRCFFNNLKSSRWVKLFLTLLTVIVLVTLLEFLGGILIEVVFDKVFWDYSNLPLHIGHYISIEMSLIWGVFSLLFIYIIKPIEDKIIRCIPKWLTILVLGLFLVDFFFTFFKVIV